MKQITVCIAGQSELKDLEIQPGTTAEDVLRNLGLSGYRLRRESVKLPFGNDENVYIAVKDGEKLVASLPNEVGQLTIG